MNNTEDAPGEDLRQQAAKETANAIARMKTGAASVDGSDISSAIKHIAAATQNEDINLPVMAPPRWHNSRRSREAEYARVILNIDRHNTVKPKPRKGLIGRILSFFR